MSHLLSTVDPEAAARLTEEAHAPSMAPPAGPEAPEFAVLPPVGEGVSYYPRPGELRAGKGVYAAIVTAINPEDGTLDLVIVYDADDFIGMRRVPARRNGEGLGWELKRSVDNARIAQLEAVVAKLTRQIFGTLSLADEDSLLGIMDEHEDRIEVVENAQQTLKPALGPAKAKAKRKAKGKASAAKPAAAPESGD